MGVGSLYRWGAVRPDFFEMKDKKTEIPDGLYRGFLLKAALDRIDEELEKAETPEELMRVQKLLEAMQTGVFDLTGKI